MEYWGKPAHQECYQSLDDMSTSPTETRERERVDIRCVRERETVVEVQEKGGREER